MSTCKRIRDRRLRHIEKARRALRRVEVDRIAKAAQAVARRARENLVASLRSGIRTAWIEWKSTLAAAEKMQDVRSVHALRIATKRLRYRVELARDLGIKDTGRQLAWLEEIQDAIGRWHDRQLLREVSAKGGGVDRSAADLRRIFRLARDGRFATMERSCGVGDVSSETRAAA